MSDWKVISSISALQAQVSNVPDQNVNVGSTPSFADVTVGGTLVSADRTSLSGVTSKVNQDVRTTASPAFAALTVGGTTIATDRTTLSTVSGRVNQSLTTTSTPTFTDVTVGATLISADRTSLATLNSRVNQDVRTTASPAFVAMTVGGTTIATDRATLSTTAGRVDQSVTTASTPVFADVSVGGRTLGGERVNWAPAYDKFTIMNGATQVAAPVPGTWHAIRTSKPTAGYPFTECFFHWKVTIAAAVTGDSVQLIFPLPYRSTATDRIVHNPVIHSSPPLFPMNRFSVIRYGTQISTNTDRVNATLTFYESDTVPAVLNWAAGTYYIHIAFTYCDNFS